LENKAFFIWRIGFFPRKIFYYKEKNKNKEKAPNSVNKATDFEISIRE